jgi:hypothetical protein
MALEAATAQNLQRPICAVEESGNILNTDTKLALPLDLLYIRHPLAYNTASCGATGVGGHPARDAEQYLRYFRMEVCRFSNPSIG